MEIFSSKAKKNFVKRYPINPKKMFKFAGPKVFISYKQKKVNWILFINTFGQFCF